MPKHDKILSILAAVLFVVYVALIWKLVGFSPVLHHKPGMTHPLP